MSRLHDELTRGAPVLERLLADGVAGRFPAEEVDMQDWKEMLKHVPRASAQASQAPESAHGSQLCSRLAEERKEESWEAMEALREKRKALRQRRIRTSDIASLAQIERAALRGGGCRSCWRPRAQPSPALERVEKARKELDEASREVLTALNLQGCAADSL